jgi:hypothetical protein
MKKMSFPDLRQFLQWILLIFKGKTEIIKQRVHKKLDTCYNVKKFS